jgi:hypothetical protein
MAVGRCVLRANRIVKVLGLPMRVTHGQHNDRKMAVEGAVEGSASELLMARAHVLGRFEHFERQHTEVGSGSRKCAARRMPDIACWPLRGKSD